MELPSWITGNNEEKKQLAAEQRDHDWQEQQQHRQLAAQPSEDQVFFNMKDNEQNNTRWLSDLTHENNDLFRNLLGVSVDENGNVVQCSKPLCSPDFIDLLKPLISVGTSKTHSHTNYGEDRYARRVRNIYDSIIDLMSETWETNGIENNPAQYTYVLEIIKTHVNNVAQRAIEDKERLHERKIYKENIVRTHNMGGPIQKGTISKMMGE